MIIKRLLSSLAAAALTLGTAQAATTTINGGGSSLAAPTYIALFKLYTASNPSILFSYEAVGSGGGQKAFLNNDITQFEGSNVPPGTLTYGTIVGTQVDLGASDAALLASQLTNPATGSYAESSVDGPLIQVPTIGTPITRRSAASCRARSPTGIRWSPPSRPARPLKSPIVQTAAAPPSC